MIGTEMATEINKSKNCNVIWKSRQKTERQNCKFNVSVQRLSKLYSRMAAGNSELGSTKVFPKTFLFTSVNKPPRFRAKGTKMKKKIIMNRKMPN